MLRVNDIHASYGPILVLHGVSLEVADGSIVTLLGPNGAGKSTTLRTISGLMHPTSGTIEFDGRRIDHLRPSGSCPSAFRTYRRTASSSPNSP
jgi:branched-chain amino acid transport system ATP-binding protein